MTLIRAQDSRWPWARWAGRRIPYLGWDWAIGPAFGTNKADRLLRVSISPDDLPWFHTNYGWWDDDSAGVGISFGTNGADQIASIQLTLPAWLARHLPGLNTE